MHPRTSRRSRCSFSVYLGRGTRCDSYNAYAMHTWLSILHASFLLLRCRSPIRRQAHWRFSFSQRWLSLDSNITPHRRLSTPPTPRLVPHHAPEGFAMGSAARIPAGQHDGRPAPEHRQALPAGPHLARLRYRCCWSGPRCTRGPACALAACSQHQDDEVDESWKRGCSSADLPACCLPCPCIARLAK